MSRLLLVIVGVLCICGCGGGGGGGSSDAFVVQIQSQRVNPKTCSIKSGDSVEWINIDVNPHRVVSGTLDKVSNPVTLSEIVIRPDNTFQPDTLEGSFGDTLQWRNATGFDFTMDIINDAGTVIATLTFANGEVKGYSQFPSAGRYTAQKRGNVFFSGTFTLYGIPNPNGAFQSNTLNNGGTFTRKFTGSGTLAYYILNVEDPSRSFITGSIVVQ
jgi:plastocyanin